MISIPGNASTSSGKVGPHMLSRAVVVTMIGRLWSLATFGKPDYIVLELARGNVPDARHEADLMIDQDKRTYSHSNRPRI